MVTRLSEGNRDEQTAVSLQHASQLAERCEASSAVALHHEPVHGVVRADVLGVGHERPGRRSDRGTGARERRPRRSPCRRRPAQRDRRRRARRLRGAARRGTPPPRTRTRPRAHDLRRAASRAPRNLDHALVGAARCLKPADGSPRALAASPGSTASSSWRTRSASSLVASSWIRVARERVPSSSFASARSRASSSAGRRRMCRNARSTNSSFETTCAVSSAASRASITCTRRSRDPSCARDVRPRRTGEGAGTARTWDRRGPREAPP